MTKQVRAFWWIILYVILFWKFNEERSCWLLKKDQFLGNGYIPVSSLREILQELDPKLTSNEIDGIIDEIDKDGSGTVDFDGTLFTKYQLFCDPFYSLWAINNTPKQSIR